VLQLLFLLKLCHFSTVNYRFAYICFGMQQLLLRLSEIEVSLPVCEIHSIGKDT
jgi:hypothetical protein